MLRAAGFDLRRLREGPTPGGSPRQAFFRLGEVILEVVQAPAGTKIAADPARSGAALGHLLPRRGPRRTRPPCSATCSASRAPPSSPAAASRRFAGGRPRPGRRVHDPRTRGNLTSTVPQARQNRHRGVGDRLRRLGHRRLAVGRRGRRRVGRRRSTGRSTSASTSSTPRSPTARAAASASSAQVVRERSETRLRGHQGAAEEPASGPPRPRRRVDDVFPGATCASAPSRACATSAWRPSTSSSCTSGTTIGPTAATGGRRSSELRSSGKIRFFGISINDHQPANVAAS